MTWSSDERLYELLPAIIRSRDHEQGQPLRTLLAIIEQELENLEADIDGLYDDLFIETCADWIIPYIGDLVGNRPLHAIVQRSRADVAKTIYYRRRKGTLAILEELARDVTGWGAHAVEFFQLLGWTQNLNHQRYKIAPHQNPERIAPNAVIRVGTANLRAMNALDQLDGPFDLITHSVDVRPPSSQEGWHNLRNVGIFLWRLQHYTMKQAVARAADANDYGFHFHPYRNPVPLFNDPVREGQEHALSTEIHVAGPIRPMAFFQQPELYYGPERGLEIIKNGTPIPLEDVICKNLSNWEPPPAGKVAIDVQRARLAFAPGEEPAKAPQVTFTYGFSADIGGGPYDRRSSLSQAQQNTLVLDVAKGSSLHTLQLALDAWQLDMASGGHEGCLIRIHDNGVYGGNIDINFPTSGGWLAIEAANGKRPTIRTVGNFSLAASSEAAEVVLNGLSIEGALELNGPVQLSIRHCTLVPGRWRHDDGSPFYPDRDSLVLGSEHHDLRVSIAKSISGPIRLSEHIAALELEDSIIQTPQAGGALRPAIAADDSQTEPGPLTRLSRCTIFGPLYVRELHASNTIFTHKVTVQRRQAGCVRFSYLPDTSISPRAYRCQPNLALQDSSPAEKSAILARLRPEFTSEHFGDPGFAQLHLACAPEITNGAEDGAEMGVFNLLQNPQRIANLRIRLDEYLPFGLQPGFIFVT